MEEAAWAAAETERILRSLPMPTVSPAAEQWAQAVARMRQPLLTHLSRSRRGLPPDGHSHWAADVQQLLHMLLGLGWSPSTLASFVEKGNNALSQTAAGVQLRLEFLQREGGLTAEEAAKAFGFSFGYTMGYTPISSLQRGVEQLREAGLTAAQLRSVLKYRCSLLSKSPHGLKLKLDCLRGMISFCNASMCTSCVAMKQALCTRLPACCVWAFVY